MTRVRQPIVVVGMLVWNVLTAGAWGADGDVVFQRRKEAEHDTPPAVFPHWSHRIRYRCYVCHPGLFKMQAGGDAVTMDDIMAGKFCGACHNGTTAWAVTFETCQRCHQAPP